MQNPYKNTRASMLVSQVMVYKYGVDVMKLMFVILILEIKSQKLTLDVSKKNHVKITIDFPFLMIISDSRTGQTP